MKYLFFTTMFFFVVLIFCYWNYEAHTTAFFSLAGEIITVFSKNPVDTLREFSQILDKELKRKFELEKTRLSFEKAFESRNYNLLKAYDDYEEVDQFRAKMRAAGTLMDIIEKVEKLDFGKNFRQFKYQIQTETYERVKKRAKKINSSETKRITNDKRNIPDRLKFKDLYDRYL